MSRTEPSICRIPLPFNNVQPGYIEWLYLDENLRITRGNKVSGSRVKQVFSLASIASC